MVIIQNNFSSSIVVQYLLSGCNDIILSMLHNQRHKQNNIGHNMIHEVNYWGIECYLVHCTYRMDYMVKWMFNSTYNYIVMLENKLKLKLILINKM